MLRRDFCKLMAAAAAARAIRVKAQAGLSAPAGFNTLHQTYEEFCATPEKDRVFYALVDGKIVEKKLNDADWSPTAWGEPHELPGGSWDGVPMTGADRWAQRRWPLPGKLGFVARIRRAGVVPRRQVRDLGALEPAVCAGVWRLVCAQHVSRRLSRLRLPEPTLRSSIRIWLQRSVPRSGRCSTGNPRL